MNAFEIAYFITVVYLSLVVGTGLKMKANGLKSPWLHAILFPVTAFVVHLLVSILLVARLEIKKALYCLTSPLTKFPLMVGEFSEVVLEAEARRANAVEERKIVKSQAPKAQTIRTESGLTQSGRRFEASYQLIAVQLNFHRHQKFRLS